MARGAPAPFREPSPSTRHVRALPWVEGPGEGGGVSRPEPPGRARLGGELRWPPALVAARIRPGSGDGNLRGVTRWRRGPGRAVSCRCRGTGSFAKPVGARGTAVGRLNTGVRLGPGPGGAGGLLGEGRGRRRFARGARGGGPRLRAGPAPPPPAPPLRLQPRPLRLRPRPCRGPSTLPRPEGSAAGIPSGRIPYPKDSGWAWNSAQTAGLGGGSSRSLPGPRRSSKVAFRARFAPLRGVQRGSGTRRDPRDGRRLGFRRPLSSFFLHRGAGGFQVG